MRSKNYAGSRALLPILAVLGACGPVRAAPVRTPVCRNTTSGTTWRIAIDLDRRTVDGLPARIAPDRISWTDPADHRRYVLDRRRGTLVVTTPSSTGGWVLRDQCVGAD